MLVEAEFGGVGRRSVFDLHVVGAALESGDFEAFERALLGPALTEGTTTTAVAGFDGADEWAPGGGCERRTSTSSIAGERTGRGAVMVVAQPTTSASPPIANEQACFVVSTPHIRLP